MSASHRLWEFKLMLGIAWADGVLDPAELDALKAWADQFEGAERTAALAAIDTPPSVDALLAEASDPSWLRQRRGFELLVHCVAMAKADGHISAEERAFLTHLGGVFRFEDDFVAMLVEEAGGTDGTVQVPG